MAKVTIVPITTLTNSLSSVAAVNENFNRIAAAIEKTLTRDGTLPNNMTADLDMNSRDLLNVGIVDAQDILVDGATLEQRLNYIIEVGQLVVQTEVDLSLYVQAAQQASVSASNSATNANTAATNALNYSLAAQQAVSDIQDMIADLGQYVIDAEAAAGAAADSALESAGSAGAAATSASTATNAASTATGAATTAGNHATAALGSANAASGSASAAAGSATAAQGSADDAAESVTEAANEVEYAKEWATNPVDVPVSVAAGGDGATTFSALHWAAEAAEAAGFDPLLYYTKTEVDGLIDGVEVDLSDYYTKAQTDTALGTKVTSAMNNIIPGTGITGGGNLANPVVIGLAPATVTSLGKADTALQPAAIGDTVQAQSANLDLLGALALAGSGGYVIAVNSTGDGFELVPQSGGGGKLELVHQDIITASGNYSAWADRLPDDVIHMEMWAGGAGGSGQNDNTGGQGGSYVKMKFTGEDIPPVAYAQIGAGGTGAPAGTVAGGAGGITSFHNNRWSVAGTPGGASNVNPISFFGNMTAVFFTSSYQTTSPQTLITSEYEPRMVEYDFPLRANGQWITGAGAAKPVALKHGGSGGSSHTGSTYFQGQLSLLGGDGGLGQDSGNPPTAGTAPGGGGGSGRNTQGANGARGEIRVNYYRSV